jgi:hypothetical protein
MAPVKVDRELIRHFLDERQTSAGGVTGKDLVQFAEQHGLHPIAFRRRVRRLLACDPDFRAFKYRGKYTPAIDPGLDKVEKNGDRLRRGPSYLVE